MLILEENFRRHLEAFASELFIYIYINLHLKPLNAADSCSSSRTLLPGFWLEPENLSISHQSSGPYTGFQLQIRIDFEVLLLL